MKIFRGFHHPGIAGACALTIGNFDGVHRGHPAILALLNNEAAHRGVDSCVLTFEPHPRDYFAGVRPKPELAPARIGPPPPKPTQPKPHPPPHTPPRRGGAGGGGRWSCFSPRRWPRNHPRTSSKKCWCAVWASAMSWWATTSALAANAPATTPCSTPPDRPGALTWRA